MKIDICCLLRTVRATSWGLSTGWHLPTTYDIALALTAHRTDKLVYNVYTLRVSCLVGFSRVPWSTRTVYIYFVNKCCIPVLHPRNNSVKLKLKGFLQRWFPSHSLQWGCWVGSSHLGMVDTYAAPEQVSDRTQRWVLCKVQTGDQTSNGGSMHLHPGRRCRKPDRRGLLAGQKRRHFLPSLVRWRSLAASSPPAPLTPADYWMSPSVALSSTCPRGSGRPKRKP